MMAMGKAAGAELLSDYAISLSRLASGMSRSYFSARCGLKPHPWQKTVLDSKAKFKIILGARQSGKSTIVSVPPAYKSKRKRKALSLVIAPTRAQANEDMIKIKDLISADPDHPSLKRNSAFEIEFYNGSRIIVVTATDKAARGYSAPDIIILDEASRIPDTVYASAVLPMQTASPDDFELIVISTPYGKDGFFYDIWNGSEVFRKFEVSAPWHVDERYPTTLFKAEDEEIFTGRLGEKGIIASYSPQHWNYEQQSEILRQQGTLIYRQEFLCEFVDRDDAVFRRDDLDRAFFPAGKVRPMDYGPKDTDSIPAVEPFGLKKIGGRYF